MGISVFVARTNQPEDEWTNVFNEAWQPDPGTDSGTSYDSDGDTLGLTVDGPWAEDLEIQKIRITFTGVPSLDLEVYLSGFNPPTIFSGYTSGQEIEVNITPADPLFGLLMQSSGDSFSVTGVEFFMAEPEPIDPSYLDMINYTNPVYWTDSGAGTHNPGTGDDGTWTSVNEAGEDLVYLSSMRKGTGDPAWTDNYVPTHARVYFTGVPTVTVQFTQGLNSTFTELTGMIENYSSGDVITLGTWQQIFGGDYYRLWDVYIGNNPGTGEFTVTKIEFGFYIAEASRACLEYTDFESPEFPAKYPDVNDLDSMEILPGSFGTFQYHPYTDMNLDDAWYPLTITSDANNFGVGVSSIPPFVDPIETTNGTLTVFVPVSNREGSSPPPVTVTVENQEAPSPTCNTFTLQFGTEVQYKTTPTEAMNDPGVELIYEEDTWDGFSRMYVPAVITVDSGNYGAVRYSRNGGDGGYSVTVTCYNRDNSFNIALYDGNNNYLDDSNSVNGQAQVYVDYPPTDDFYIVIQHSVLQAVADFRVMWPMPF